MNCIGVMDYIRCDLTSGYRWQFGGQDLWHPSGHTLSFTHLLFYVFWNWNKRKTLHIQNAISATVGNSQQQNTEDMHLSPHWMAVEQAQRIKCPMLHNKTYFIICCFWLVWFFAVVSRAEGWNEAVICSPAQYMI